MQAYALKTILEQMGHEVYILDWYSEVNGLWKKPFGVIRRMVEKYLLGRDTNVFILIPNHFALRHLSGFIKSNFRKHYIRRWSMDEFEGFDGFIVGSDQVWRPKYSWGVLDHAFLDFCIDSNMKKIAYAASFGTDDFEFSDEERARYTKLLKGFDGISVREAGGVKICRDYFDAKALHVLDPTLLLSKVDYMKLAGIGENERPRGGLMSYILDDSPETDSLVSQIAKEKGLSPYRANSRYEDHDAPLKERIQPSISNWLRAFYNSDFVVTDSFHACVFSIIFGKTFVVLGNQERGMSRFHSLLDMFGCRHHLIMDPSEYDPNADYSIPASVADTISSWRELSMRFLKTHLENRN